MISIVVSLLAINAYSEQVLLNIYLRPKFSFGFKVTTFSEFSEQNVIALRRMSHTSIMFEEAQLDKWHFECLCFSFHLYLSFKIKESYSFIKRNALVQGNMYNISLVQKGMYNTYFYMNCIFAKLFLEGHTIECGYPSEGDGICKYR